MEIYNETLDETIIAGQLQNGLNYYIIPKCMYGEKRALLTVKYGSVDSVFNIGGTIYETPPGCAHFLEHKLFDNERGSAFDSFSRLGSYVNAYTSFNNTAYYFSCEKNFEENLETLFGFVTEPYFTNESVEKEIPIIAQEIKMYDDNPGWASYFGMLSCLYGNHPAKNNIAGKTETIGQITADTLYRCYEGFYKPENMYLVCAGGLDPDEIGKTTEIALKYMNGGGKKAKTVLPIESANVMRASGAGEMNISRPVFHIGLKDRFFENQLRKSCVYKITLDLLSGESSKLNEKLANGGIIDDALSFDYINGDGYGYAVISGESMEPEAVLEELVKKSREIIADGFEEKDFKRLKKKHLGRFVRGFNSVEAITMASAEYAVKAANLFDCYEDYMSVEIDECVSLLEECFREGGYAISVLKPVT